MRYHRYFTVLALSSMIALASTPLWAAGPGRGAGFGANSNQGMGSGNLRTACLVSPAQQLNETEIDHLLFMYEEEKLARDLYLEFADLWGLPQFANIAASEQRHMDALKCQLDKHAIADPVADFPRGVLANPELQDLHDDLLVQGQASAQEALRIGALVEEIDIEDLDKAMAATTNQELVQTYANLQRGSRNHLRTFAGSLERVGIPYTAQWLDEETVDAILNSPMERGGQGRGNGGARGPGRQGGPNGGRFGQ